MNESIEMIAEDSDAPSFGGGATRVVSEDELDGLIDATRPGRAPKETKRIEALARIAPRDSGPRDAGNEQAVATEAALLDAAVSGEHVQPSAPQPRWRRTLWYVLIVAAAVGGAAAARMFLH